MNRFVRFYQLLCIILAGLLGYVIFNAQPKVSSSESRYSIAILIPMSHPSLEAIAQGFIETLERKLPQKCTFKVYNGNGNRTLMLAQAQEIISKHYDLIVPIATTPANIIKELASSKNIAKPIVFLAAEVHEPIATMTGVNDHIILEDQLKALYTLKPDIKTMMLVYNAAEPRFENERKKIEALLKSRNTTLTTVEVYATNEMYIKTSSRIAIERPDAIMVLKDNIVVSGIDALITLCNKHSILLCASDLDSVDKGAGAGYGVHEYDIGIVGANQAFDILFRKIKPEHIKVATVDNFKLKINNTALLKQGLTLDSKTLFLMKYGEVV